ncbi:MAG: hypothetical protein K0B11_17660, partial [Mariniphaga sp.]|nr:hypothetical protein [Mariniphaga sp.]
MENPSRVRRIPKFVGHYRTCKTECLHKTASEDIHKHTVLNDDWPEEWIFTDDRFNILHSSDKDFLDFL